MATAWLNRDGSIEWTVGTTVIGPIPAAWWAALNREGLATNGRWSIAL